jgi:hypothetical protein
MVAALKPDAPRPLGLLERLAASDQGPIQGQGYGTDWTDGFDPQAEAAQVSRWAAMLHGLRAKAADDTAAAGAKPKMDRDFHSKGHGAGAAKLWVIPDLPDEYRYGLFAEPGWHDADYRLSNGNLSYTAKYFDALGDVRGLGIKVERRHNAALWTGEVACSQDFNGTNIRPFAKTPGEFVAFGVATATLFTTIVNHAKTAANLGSALGTVGKSLGAVGGVLTGLVAGTGKMLKSYLTNPDVGADLKSRVFETARMLGTIGIKTSRPVRSLASEEYEVAVIQVGPTAGRLVIAPSEETKASLKKSWKFWRRNYLRENWDENRARGAMTFDLFLLPYKNESDTPIDKPHVAWKTNRVKVAQLVVPPLGDPEEKAEDEARVNKEQFQPFHTFEERSRRADLSEEERRQQGHTPLGPFQRARGEAYQGSADDRGASGEPVLAPHKG